MDVCTAIVKTLESAGVDACFLGGGQGSGGLSLAFADSGIRSVLVRNEQAASFMACGYSMFSPGRIAVCSAQGGPGSVNLLSGLGIAYTAGYPMLTLVSYAPKKWIGKGDLGECSGLSRTPDAQEMFGSTTKKSFIIDDKRQIYDVLEEALNLAFEGRPGPVHINLDYAVGDEEAPPLRPITVEVKPITPSPKKVELFADALARYLKEGKKVALYIGAGCVRSGAGEALQAFVERFQIPFIHSMDAKGVIPDNHPLCVGMGGIGADPGATTTFREAEVVLAIGNSFAKWSMWRFQQGLFDDKILMHVNIDPHESVKAYAADFAMVSDARLAVEAIHEALDGRIGPIEPARPAMDKWIDHDVPETSEGMHPALLSREISRLLPDRAILLGDAGSHMIWLAAHSQLNRGQIYKNPGSFGPMASHVNAAIGVQLAHPDRRVIVGCGDGAYQMSGFELLTAVYESIPIVWVVFNNAEFNIIKTFMMITRQREALNHVPHMDYAMYARSCGANGWRVEKPEDFAPAFEAALASGKPSLIDVAVDAKPLIPFSPYEP